MYKGYSLIAIIPARCGSKGLPNKNIKNLNGKPLMSWSIETALKCNYIDEVMVSTDSEEYAKIARRFGANVPFIRPDKYASDTASRKDLIQHTIDFYKKKGRQFDYIVFLEPTSPLRVLDDLNKSIEKLLNDKNGAESIVGICKLENTHPEFLVELDNGFLDPYSKQPSKILRRQDINTLYFYEGSLYISETNAYLEKEFYHSKTLGYIVPRWKSLEIDEIEDFVMIESIMKYKKYK